MMGAIWTSVRRVALLAEGVDRNHPWPAETELQRHVALLAEGVDRNGETRLYMGGVALSPSSRRAWIEIQYIQPLDLGEDVALLAEGVDRNIEAPNPEDGIKQSPSSRRAWIEIWMT